MTFSKLYLRASSDLPHDRVLPSYNARGVALEWVRSNNGREYCGWPLHHLFELYCTVHQIEHRTTKVGSPEMNDMIEGLHRTLKDDVFILAHRREVCTSVDEPQASFDEFMIPYNAKRAHHGYRTQERTPTQTSLNHLTRSEVAPIAAWISPTSSAHCRLDCWEILG